MFSCLSLLCMCGLGLRSFSGLVCDLLPRRLFHGSPKAHSRRVSRSQSWRALLGWHVLAAAASREKMGEIWKKRQGNDMKNQQKLKNRLATAASRKKGKTNPKKDDLVPFLAKWRDTIPWALLFLVVKGAWLWELVSPRIRANLPKLWFVKPTRRVGLKIKSAPGQFLGFCLVNWVLTTRSGQTLTLPLCLSQLVWVF